VVTSGKTIKKDILPFYLIFFQDVDSAEREVKELISRAFPHGLNPFNETVYYGDEVDIDRLISSFQTPPFFAGRHLLLLRRAERLKREDREALFRYLKKPGPFGFLIALFEMDQKSWRQYSGLFRQHQRHFFFSGEEAEIADSFGIINALRKRDAVGALRILDRQYREDRDFYRFFGILSWFLRNQVENYHQRLTPREASLFQRIYEIEKKFRQGKIDGRTGLELIILTLV